MNSFASAALSLAMLAAIVLVIGGARLAYRRETRGRGLLMIAAATVLVMNVMIWTV